eukprot:c2113_g1_i1.p1 GENE.c2113_g1_i1~~c2113_g1_i1.p1  ORF type:complete len:326 (+),score=70.20 c2113_g1_i1:84-980(+)
MEKRASKISVEEVSPRSNWDFQIVLIQIFLAVLGFVYFHDLWFLGLGVTNSMFVVFCDGLDSCLKFHDTHTPKAHNTFSTTLAYRLTLSTLTKICSSLVISLVIERASVVTLVSRQIPLLLVAVLLVEAVPSNFMHRWFTHAVVIRPCLAITVALYKHRKAILVIIGGTQASFSAPVICLLVCWVVDGTAIIRRCENFLLRAPSYSVSFLCGTAVDALIGYFSTPQNWGMIVFSLSLCALHHTAVGTLLLLIVRVAMLVYLTHRLVIRELEAVLAYEVYANAPIQHAVLSWLGKAKMF